MSITYDADYLQAVIEKAKEDMEATLAGVRKALGSDALGMSTPSTQQLAQFFFQQQEQYPPQEWIYPDGSHVRASPWILQLEFCGESGKEWLDRFRRWQRQQVTQEGLPQMGQQKAADWFGLDDLPPDEDEVEPVYLCDPAQLPPLTPPWWIVQGYRDPEHSLRLIPSRQMTFARLKVPGIASLTRQKTSKRQPYEVGVRTILTLPRIAVKERYIVRDASGRAWLIDHLLTGGGAWLAETELQDKPQPAPPPFAVKELTTDPQGFTYSYAVPMTREEIQHWIAEAADRGSRGDYSPSENPRFDWTSPSGDEPPTPSLAGMHAT